MEVKSWVLVGLLRISTCSLAFAGRSVLRDSRSSLTPVLRRSTRPTDLPFLPFGVFSSGIVCSPVCYWLGLLLAQAGGASPTPTNQLIVTPAKKNPDH